MHEAANEANVLSGGRGLFRTWRRRQAGRTPLRLKPETDSIMREPYDARTAGCVSTAWLILINKPMYPICVSALLGADAATRSLATLALAPFYAATPFLAQRSACGARIALPLIGLADTLYATKLMGAETGTELFAVACGLLAITGFSAREAAVARTLSVVVYGVFVVAHGRYGVPLQAWTSQEAATLFTLNFYAAASLAAFIGLRFAAAA